MTRPAVDEVTFDVPAGTFVVLLGPSGCGKTTLLKMVNRLIEPTAGEVLLDGVEVGQLPVTALRRQIGYVIQQVGLFPHMTVERNIAVVPELLAWPRARIQARVEELLALVGLPPGEYARRYPAQLSGGQQQRVGLARALAADPKFMLMDEPFGAIDAITRASLQAEMLRVQRRLRKTVLFVTHDVEEALRLADYIVILRAGRVVQTGTPLELLTHPADAFVRELVGADDIVRQLGVVRVETAMTPFGAGETPDVAPTVGCMDDLRHALSTMLQTGAEVLTVVDGSEPVGRLTLDEIRLSAQGRAKA